LSKILLRVGRS